MKRLNTKKGFTILEVTIVIGIMGLLAVLITPFMLLSVQNTSLEGEVRSFVSAIRHIQVHSKTKLDNKKYGLKLYSDKYNIFVGNNFATAESNVDVFFPIGITISQMNLSSSSTEISFGDNSVLPLYTGNLTMTNLSSNFRIFINSEGLIYYQKL